MLQFFLLQLNGLRPDLLQLSFLFQLGNGFVATVCLCDPGIDAALDAVCIKVVLPILVKGLEVCPCYYLIYSDFFVPFFFVIDYRSECHMEVIM